MKFYLEQLINALHAPDIERLQAIDLKKSKIKIFLNTLIDNRKSGFPKEEELRKQLQLDANSYRKMKAVLLQKCLKTLVPEGGIKLLEFLGRYRLSELFMREAGKLISVVEKSKHITPLDKASIYKHCYLGSTRLPFSLFDESRLSVYEAGFLKNYSLPDKVIQFNVLKLNGVFVRIVQTFFSMQISEENYKKFSAEIKTIEQNLKDAKSERINVFIDGIYAVLDFYYQKISVEIKHRFEKIFNRYQLLKSNDTQDEIFTVKFYLAYYETMAGNYEYSMQLFEELEKDFPELIRFSPKITFRYTLVLGILKETEKMKRVIDLYMKKYLQSYDPDGKVLTCLALVVYHLLLNETEKASEYIRIFQNNINRKALLAYDIGIRMFEIIVFYQRADDKFAEQQFTKLIRYLQDRTDVAALQKSVHLNKSLRNAFGQYIHNKISLSEFEKSINDIFTGNNALVAVLFINAAKIRATKKNYLVLIWFIGLNIE